MMGTKVVSEEADEPFIYFLVWFVIFHFQKSIAGLGEKKKGKEIGCFCFNLSSLYISFALGSSPSYSFLLDCLVTPPARHAIFLYSPH